MSKPLAAYRRLLRSVRSTFKGDDYMQTGALVEIKRRFRESAGVTEEAEVERLCGEAQEAAEFLKTFVVQAALNDRGNFEMQVQPHHAEAIAEEAALRPDRKE